MFKVDGVVQTRDTEDKVTIIACRMEIDPYWDGYFIEYMVEDGKGNRKLMKEEHLKSVNIN
jgi:hypothetical protein